MNAQTTAKIMNFLQSKGVEGVAGVDDVEIDFQTETLDINWITRDDALRFHELKSVKEIAEFLEFLASD